MRVKLFECPVDILDMDEALANVREAMHRHRRLHHVAINVAKLVNMQSDPALAADVNAGDLVTIDGMGIAYALRLQGHQVGGRVTGIDLMEKVIELCAREGYRPYFLGATPAVIATAVERLKARYPSLELAGYRDGYFRPEDEPGIVAEIAASNADCIFVGMPTPRKERFLAAYGDELDVPFTMGVGGSFDVIAGHVDRAPAFMQRHGLEWLYRVYQEPRRMWWRYARTNTVFAGMLLTEQFRRWSGASRPHSGA